MGARAGRVGQLAEGRCGPIGGDACHQLQQGGLGRWERGEAGRGREGGGSLSENSVRRSS